ncbi:9457_t:CDS:2, partial [Diversispora eburnea]
MSLKKTKGSTIYQLGNISFSQASKLLQDTNIKFQYETDFNSSFSYTLSTTSSEIEELKLFIIIENKQKNNVTKTLIISPIDFDNEIPENSLSSDFNTEKIKVFHKKNKSRAVQKENLISKQMTRAQVINGLSEKYRCSIHLIPCFIINSKHLQLNLYRLQLWARKIVIHAVTISKQENTSQSLISNVLSSNNSTNSIQP